ncbi:hypothetical protein ACQEU5_05190 [Marinactinospora thermotolerans]|uniref:Tryptophan-associated transmembrane protein (Trp_oprn_chp) n=1 Tax=Marinactinospora thermotolerans DSM 45154 TaxID=1122192 RepID=A0A1T4QNC3_9ACTN|nr:hypothetical protein SAMN02745673_02331 [Marinactinospora thermotolerans DSM 45154]
MLRHLLGLPIGLLVTPLLWAGTAWSAATIEARMGDIDPGDPTLLTAVAAVMAIGLVCGVLAGSRVSPLAAFVSGGALLAVGLWPLLDPGSLASVLPSWIAPGSLFHPLGPALPLNLALGTLLFISSLTPSRWRSRPRADGPRPGAEPRIAAAPPVAGPLPADDDSSRTTTPFRRGENGFETTTWGSPDPGDQTRVLRDDR